MIDELPQSASNQTGDVNVSGQTSPSAQQKQQVNPEFGSEELQPQPVETVQPSQPQSSEPTLPEITQPKVKRKFGRIFKFSVIILVAGSFLLVASGCFAYAIAYEKICLGKPKIEKPIQKFVLSLPFMPKTPRFLLESSASAHKDVSHHSFDLSLAVRSDEFVASPLGLSAIDFEVKGDVDFANPKNIMASLNVSITKNLNIDIRKKDAIVYFKINKLPTLLFTFLKIDEDKMSPLLDNWISYDTSPLETEARKYLDEKVKQETATQEFIEKATDKLLEKQLLEAIELSKEEIDNYPCHKLHLIMTDEIIDQLDKKSRELIEEEIQQPKIKKIPPKGASKEVKMSDTIKDFVIDMWIDEKTYYMRKMVASFKAVETDNSTRPSSFGSLPFFSTDKFEASFAMALILDNFDQPITVEIPAESVTVEEVVKLLSEKFNEDSQLSSSPSGQPIDMLPFFPFNQ